jgi:eukaryotic-like serine/threonine-protein kinase
VLPEVLAAEPQFRARFENEARAISSLDHPHICALFDVGQHEGTSFLVMQYLEGETLASRLARGSMPLAEVLRCAREIADALGTAHRAGVVHRDLKPGNVMLTKSGAKLLDFGLARSARSGIVQTMTSAVQTAAPDLTAQGTIVGTIQYMAPEQLEAKEADARTDVFAFGAMLYEMLTGRKAFESKSQAGLIAAILDHEPPAPSTLQPLMPAALDRLVKTCLAKDPERRWQSAGDLAREIAWIAEARSEAVVSLPSGRRAVWKTAVTLTAGALIGVAIGYVALRALTSPSQSSGVLRVLIDVAPAERLRASPSDQTLAAGHVSRTAFALSPDGQTLVFSAVQNDRQQLYVRPVSRLEATALAGTDGASSPFFSPDGQWVGFWAAGSLKRIPLGGGSATTICDTNPIFGASWGDNGFILFANETGGLRQVPDTGGAIVDVTRIDDANGEVSHRLPHVLPGSGAVLFTVMRTLLPTWSDDTQIAAQTLSGGVRTVVVEGGADARYVRTGHLLYVRQGTLSAAPFDVSALRVTGGGVTIVGDLMQSANMPNTDMDAGAGQFSVSESGSLAYVRGGVFEFAQRQLVWVDRAGRIAPLSAPPRPYLYPRLSPDATKVLVSTQGDRNIWVYDLGRGTTTRLTVEGRNMAAVWTPDGTRVTFGSAGRGRENLFQVPPDGSGSAERLTEAASQHRAGSWSPNGRTLVFVDSDGQARIDIAMLDMEGTRKPLPLFATRFTENYPDLSPDGRWIAYSSNESGRAEVYVAPYARPGPKVLVSVAGGHSPAWTGSGREIVYLAPRGPDGSGPYAVTAVSVNSTPGAIETGKQRALFETPMGLQANVRGYDVTRDGSRFLMVQPIPRQGLRPSQIVLVQNWFEDLRRIRQN